MASEFYGETEITPEELYQYSKGASRLQQIAVNGLLLAVIGVIGWFVVPPIMEYFGLVATGAGVVTEIVKAEIPEGSIILPSPGIVRTILVFVVVIFLVLKLIYHFILKPWAKMVFHRTVEKRNAVANAMAGSVTYKIDRYGLEYNIRSSKATNKFKLYWRNFTDAEYSPEIIRFFKGKNQTAFILMRAFPGLERQVGQFIESTMNKQKNGS